MKKLNLFASSFLMSLTSFATISCSQNVTYDIGKSSDNNLSNHQISNQENQQKLEYNFDFLFAYQKEEYESRNKKLNGIWNHNETIYENEKYRIAIDSVSDTTVYVDFFNKEVSRYYLIEFKFSREIFPSEKEIVNKIIIEESMLYYENNLVFQYSLNNDEIWIPFSNSKKSIEIINDAYTSFRSSWGVSNSSTKSLNLDFNFSSNLIKESLLTTKYIDDDRVVIDSLRIKELYYLPLVEVIKTPIWHSRYWQDNIKLNNVDIFNDIKNNRYDLILPEGSSSGQEWWHGLISAIGLGVFVSNIILLFCSGSSSMLISEASYNALKWLSNGRFGLSLVWGFIKESHENNLETNVDETVDNIKKLGIKTKIYEEIDIKRENKININGRVKYDAKATNIFGRQSKAKVKDIVGISNVDITWKEYKKFNNVEKI